MFYTYFGPNQLGNLTKFCATSENTNQNRNHIHNASELNPCCRLPALARSRACPTHTKTRVVCMPSFAFTVKRASFKCSKRVGIINTSGIHHQKRAIELIYGGVQSATSSLRQRTLEIYATSHFVRTVMPIVATHERRRNATNVSEDNLSQIFWDSPRIKWLRYFMDGKFKHSILTTP